ncbi:MAG: hypothetical protein PHX08_26775 [Lachnospiraceae bacterium]|nr:hypothetical protein [Lachnospiraceae bacterium]
MNRELVKSLKHVKEAIVNKEMEDKDLDDQQEAIRNLENVVSYLNDLSGRGIDLGNKEQ